MKARGVTLAGSVLGGILASVCCIGPLVFALLGISRAAFAQSFERPYFLVDQRSILRSRRLAERTRPSRRG